MVVVEYGVPVMPFVESRTTGVSPARTETKTTPTGFETGCNTNPNPGVAGLPRETVIVLAVSVPVGLFVVLVVFLACRRQEEAEVDAETQVVEEGGEQQELDGIEVEVRAVDQVLEYVRGG